jgi:hypothetical protein
VWGRVLVFLLMSVGVFCCERWPYGHAGFFNGCGGDGAGVWDVVDDLRITRCQSVPIVSYEDAKGAMFALNGTSYTFAGEATAFWHKGQCPPGTVLFNADCSPCPEHTYSDPTNGCVACTNDQYCPLATVYPPLQKKYLRDFISAEPLFPLNRARATDPMIVQRLGQYYAIVLGAMAFICIVAGLIIRYAWHSAEVRAFLRKLDIFTMNHPVLVRPVLIDFVVEVHFLFCSLRLKLDMCNVACFLSYVNMSIILMHVRCYRKANH